jgi:hypothetical protein
MHQHGQFNLLEGVALELEGARARGHQAVHRVQQLRNVNGAVRGRRRRHRQALGILSCRHMHTMIPTPHSPSASARAQTHGSTHTRTRASISTSVSCDPRASCAHARLPRQRACTTGRPKRLRTRIAPNSRRLMRPLPSLSKCDTTLVQKLCLISAHTQCSPAPRACAGQARCLGGAVLHGKVMADEHRSRSGC